MTEFHAPRRHNCKFVHHSTASKYTKQKLTRDKNKSINQSPVGDLNISLRIIVGKSLLEYRRFESNRSVCICVCVYIYTHMYINKISETL